jgi:hypothetical protein
MSDSSLSPDGFEFGNPKVNEHSGSCCGKPQGCTMTHDGCLYLRHPWKRSALFNERVCWRCGADVDLVGDLCGECLKHWECPACHTAVPRSYVTCHLCAVPKPEGVSYV